MFGILTYFSFNLLLSSKIMLALHSFCCYFLFLTGLNVSLIKMFLGFLNTPQRLGLMCHTIRSNTVNSYIEVFYIFGLMEYTVPLQNCYQSNIVTTQLRYFRTLLKKVSTRKGRTGEVKFFVDSTIFGLFSSI